MVDWLDRARREIPKRAGQGTAVTAKRNLTAVLAVTHLGKSEISSFSNDSNGSTLAAGFREIKSRKLDSDTLHSVSPISNTANQQAKIEISKNVGQATAITDERNLASGKTPYSNDCLPYHERRALYARQNAFYCHLQHRLSKFEIETDSATLLTLDDWAGDEAIRELYAGRRSWKEQRRFIYIWAKAELAAIRRHREKDNRTEMSEGDCHVA